MTRVTHPTKVFTYEIPLDLHLVGWLRLNRASDFRAYFDDAERIAKEILRADEPCKSPDRPTLPSRRQPPSVLDRKQRIARVILGACDAGRRALKQRKKNEALTHAYRILDFKAEFFSEPDRFRGANIGKYWSESSKKRTRRNEERNTKWRRRAVEIWRQQPNLSFREIARIIKRETGSKNAWETIRKVIHKKQGNT